MTSKKWFKEDFLPYIAPESVIVMDSVSNHSKQDKPPSTDSRKADIVAWLSSKNILRTASQMRHELLQLVKMNKSPAKDYKLDSIARERPHSGGSATVPLRV